jgi:hypothetical protein
MILTEASVLTTFNIKKKRIIVNKTLVFLMLQDLTDFEIQK